MRRIICVLAAWLLLYPSPGPAAQIKVESVTADVQNSQRRIMLRFSEALPAALDALTKEPSNYAVTEAAPNPDGVVVPAVEAQRPPLKVDFPPPDPDTGEVNRKRLLVTISGAGLGKGRVWIKQMKLGDDVVEAAEWNWIIEQPYNLAGSNFDASLNFGEPIVGKFSYSYTTNFRWGNNGKSVSRRWFNVEGSVPVTTPHDVKDTPGAETDATGQVSDFVQASFSHRWYNGTNYQSLGLIARSTGRLRGLELVGRYQPAALFFAGGHGFLGAETEVGYRSGDNEWKNLTEQAPDRGHLVARIGAVIEWVPSLGPVNRDLGHGLRFFVRGRGWADYVKDDSGDNDLRFRGFFDSELFYNFTKDYRVFLRHEQGYLPPDLSRRTSRVFIGVGTAF
jgi:hypothetical protein